MKYILSVAATGVSISTSGTSSDETIPDALDGALPKHCYISCTAACHVRWGVGAQTAVATDLLLQPGHPLVINTAGSDTIAAIQQAAGGVLIVTPLES